ncbi:MAG: zinc ribbon domain-containing protein [Candidatus Hydrogenedentes bacterium]|nr:zinc ribbon domain-containing protein [Candidatus Hydrogenedentota bacterium]
MPLFTFTCEECGQTSELLTSGTDTGSLKCPACGSPKLKKALSSFAVKGTSSGASCPTGTCPFS